MSVEVIRYNTLYLGTDPFGRQNPAILNDMLQGFDRGEVDEACNAELLNAISLPLHQYNRQSWVLAFKPSGHSTAVGPGSLEGFVLLRLIPSCFAGLDPRFRVGFGKSPWYLAAVTCPEPRALCLANCRYLAIQFRVILPDPVRLP